MSRVYTVGDLNNSKYYKLPKAFFHNPIYKSMKSDTKLAYTILKDLLELSVKNNWVNEYDEVYVKLSREKMMGYLNIKGSEKISKIMKELKAHELIIEKRLGPHRCNEIYVCIPEDLDIIYTDEELLEYEKNDLTDIENTKTFENRRSRLSKIEGQDFRKSKVKTFENRSHTKTNITKTKLTKTNITNNNKSNTKSISKTKSKKVKNTKKDLVVVEAVRKILSSKKINDKDIVKIVSASKGNIEVIKEKYELSKSVENIKNFTGWLISAIKEDYKQTKVTNTKTSSNTFNDYTQRKYDYDELEKRLLGWDKEENDEDKNETYVSGSDFLKGI